MKVFVEGHLYGVQNSENPDNYQKIQFIQKVPKAEGSTELITIQDGTTNEELIEVLIDRLKHLQAKFPCRENAIAITKQDESLMWLNKRTADRQKRNVEGKQIA